MEDEENPWGIRPAASQSATRTSAPSRDHADSRDDHALPRTGSASLPRVDADPGRASARTTSPALSRMDSRATLARGTAPSDPANPAGCLRSADGRGVALRRVHQALVEGPLGAAFLAVLSGCHLALFAYSLVLLKPTPSQGSGCGVDACVRGGGGTCTAFASNLLNQTCDLLCDAAAMEDFIPFRFQPATLPPGSWLSCPFPRRDAIWRITCNFLTATTLLLAVAAYQRRWHGAPLLLLCAALLILAGILFYVMIRDSHQVNSASLNCRGSFAALTPFYAPPKSVRCEMTPFVAVCIAEGVLIPTLVYASTILLARWRVLAAVFAEGGAGAVRSWGRRSPAPASPGDDQIAADFGSSELPPEVVAARKEDDDRARQKFSEG